MLSSNSFFTGAHIWLTSAIFVAAITLSGSYMPGPSAPSPYPVGARPGMIPAPDVREETAQRLLEIQLSELMYMEEVIMDQFGQMIAVARDPGARMLLEQHRKETAAHSDRLRSAFDALGTEPGDAQSAAFDGLIADNERLLAEFTGSPLHDEVIVANFRRIEHHMIGSYMNAIHTAQLMGLDEEVIAGLKENLRIEQEMEAALGELADERIEQSPAGDEERPDVREEAEPRHRPIPE
jgi:ferritin-like metal-binding protein YciE